MECAFCHSGLSADAVYCPACGTLQPDAQEPEDYQYAAFISYRHLPADQKVAIDVQKAIETFQLPKGIDSPIGVKYAGSARKLGKCFRDEDELAAVSSLPDRITQALEKSRTLVVVCSPDTPKSEWMMREIELFAQLHGRDRIFAVLASGSSEESIPDFLKTRTVLDVDGVARTMPAEPLAADFRLAAASKLVAEKTRILAAVAGCEFDDLRQRDLSRKRRRAVGLTSVIAAVVALVAVFGAFAYSNMRQAQISESYRLAIESQQLLAQGDRYGAIEKALDALPKSDNGGPFDKPVVPEAKEALERAVVGYMDYHSPWHPLYSITTENPVGALMQSMRVDYGTDPLAMCDIAVSDSGGFFAVSDDGGVVAVYDVRTGRLLADLDIPERATPYPDGFFGRYLVAANDYLFVSHIGQCNANLVYEVRTGEIIHSSAYGMPTWFVWTMPGTNIASAVSSPRYGGYTIRVFDFEGDIEHKFYSSDMQKFSLSMGAFNMLLLGDDGYPEHYTLISNQLFRDNLSEKTSESVLLKYEYASSLISPDGDLIVAATCDPLVGNSTDRPYAIEVFDGSLNSLWSFEGEFSSETMQTLDSEVLLLGEPVAKASKDGKIIGVSAGRSIVFLNAETGMVVYRRSFDRTVLDFKFADEVRNSGPVITEVLDGLILDSIGAGNGDVRYSVSIVCSDGTVVNKGINRSGSDAEGDGTRLAMPFPIRWAHIIDDGDLQYVLAMPADESGRIVAYEADYSQHIALEDHPLVELREQANGILVEAGREPR